MLNVKIILLICLTVFISKSLQVTVDCEYKILNRWKVAKDSYGCLISHLDIKSKLPITNATGTHFPGKNNSDVKALKIAGRCEILPSGLGSIFPNIEVLSIWKANMKYISNIDLQQFKNLREIWIYVNELEYLESTMFQYNPKVEVINFSANNIKYIGARFFDYLPNLRKAYFTYNKCTGDKAEDPVNLQTLKDKIKENCPVDETSNTLEVTIDCEYKNAPEWEGVDDSYGCFLTTLDIKTKLFAMNATGTHLDGKTNEDVKSLNINGGVCAIIPSAIGSIFPNIEVLSVWNASLKIISYTDLQQFSNLREIYLQVNDLDYLESKLFEYNPNVEVIGFKNNQIKYIGGSFFDYLPNLKRADFRFNDCINDDANIPGKIAAMKDQIKEMCIVPGPEPRGSTTIRPDGLTYWVNSTAVDGGEGFGGYNSDGSLDPKVFSSLVG